MKTITQYKEDIKNLMKKVADIDAKATAENRDLVSEELSLKDEMMNVVEDTNNIITNLTRQERIGTLLEQPEGRQTVEKDKKVISVQEKRGIIRIHNYCKMIPVSVLKI